MNLNKVIAHLRTYAPGFSGRVAGAAQFKRLDQKANLPTPAAYVVPLDDSPEENWYQNTVRQPLMDAFSVIVAIDNSADERGQAAIEFGHDTVRGWLWGALLGWQPDNLGAESRYRGCVYQGGHILAADRSRLWYEFDFAAYMEVTEEDGYQPGALANLPHFDGMTLRTQAPGGEPYADDSYETPGYSDEYPDNTIVVPNPGIFP